MKITMAFFILAALLVVPGCESSGGGSTSRGGTPGSGSGSGSGAKAGTGDEFGPDARALMNEAWRAFKQDSPEWPGLRTEWVALGDRATSTLVENLYRGMVLARLRNYPEGYAKGRRELILLGDLALPTLAGVMENAGYTNPETNQREQLSSGLLIDTAEVMALTGAPSVPYFTNLVKVTRPSVRRAAVDGLGKTGLPAAARPLAGVLSGSGDWIDRMTAARALGNVRSPESEAALVRALDDPDSAVVEVSARSLAILGARGALPALDRRRARAQAAEEFKIAAACGAAANAIRSGR